MLNPWELLLMTVTVVLAADCSISDNHKTSVAPKCNSLSFVHGSLTAVGWLNWGCSGPWSSLLLPRPAAQVETKGRAQAQLPTCIPRLCLCHIC